MQSARAAPVPSATKSPSGVEEAHEDVAAARESIARDATRDGREGGCVVPVLGVHIVSADLPQ